MYEQVYNGTGAIRYVHAGQHRSTRLLTGTRGIVEGA
jgi:hypothetical protein